MRSEWCITRDLGMEWGISFLHDYFQSDSFPYGTFDEVIDHFCVWNVKILEHKITHKAF